MRYLSIFLPRLPTDRILRRARAPSSAPLAVWTKVKGGDYLAAVDARAETLGLAPGTSVADARAMRPELELAEAEPEACAELLGALADWCRRFTPLSALDPPDGVMLDVTGAAHLFGGEAAMLTEIERLLKLQGFTARLAIAPGSMLARALARFSTRRSVAPNASQQEIETIAASLPIAALGLAEPARGFLARAGLRLIGDLLARPRAPIAARFGSETLARLDALACRTREAISPQFEAPDFLSERRFPEGLTRRESIEAALKALAHELCALLERHGLGARQLVAAFYRVDGAVLRIETGTSRPLRDPLLFIGLLRERLAAQGEDGLDAGYGFDVLQLWAARAERYETEQERLGLGGAEESSAPDLADLIDKLGARLGLRRVLRLYPRETHVPEFAIAAVPAAFPPPPPALPKLASFPKDATRPLRLLERPEPVEAIALLPDGPPLRFRWRRTLHELSAFEGPERIAPPWWSASEGASTRDYFRVEDKNGRRFWLYREGLAARECARPRWFMHGFF